MKDRVWFSIAVAVMAVVAFASGYYLSDAGRDIRAITPTQPQSPPEIPQEYSDLFGVNMNILWPRVPGNALPIQDEGSWQQVREHPDALWEIRYYSFSEWEGQRDVFFVFYADDLGVEPGYLFLQDDMNVAEDEAMYWELARQLVSDLSLEHQADLKINWEPEWHDEVFGDRCAPYRTGKVATKRLVHDALPVWSTDVARDLVRALSAYHQQHPNHLDLYINVMDPVVVEDRRTFPWQLIYRVRVEVTPQPKDGVRDPGPVLAEFIVEAPFSNDPNEAVLDMGEPDRVVPLHYALIPEAMSLNAIREDVEPLVLWVNRRDDWIHAHPASRGEVQIIPPPSCLAG